MKFKKNYISQVKFTYYILHYISIVQATVISNNKTNPDFRKLATMWALSLQISNNRYELPSIKAKGIRRTAFSEIRVFQKHSTGDSLSNKYMHLSAGR